MVTGRAEVKTASARRICQRLLKHWSHRFKVTHTATEGTVIFGDSSCEMRADEDRLVVTVHAPSDAALSDIESVVAEHLQRMAAKEVLSFQWSH